MFLFSLLLVTVLAVPFWLILFWPWLQKRKTFDQNAFVWRRAALQVLSATVLFDGIANTLSGNYWFILNWLSPPIYVAFEFAQATPFLNFLSIPLAVGLVPAVACFLLTRRSKYRFFLATSIFWLAAGGILSLWAKHLQDEDILKLKPDCYEQIDFWHSRSVAGEEFQFSLHVLAMKNGKKYGWSFRELEFYAIPESAAQNMSSCMPKNLP